MAQANSPIIYSSHTAAADLSTKQYHIVRQIAENTVNLTTAATQLPAGVLQNKPKLGEIAEIAEGGHCKVILGGTVSVNDPLVSDSNGKAIAATRAAAGQQPLSWVIGFARRAGVANDVIEMEVAKLPY